MNKTIKNGLSIWQFESLQQVDSIKHFVTDRKSYSTEKEFTLGNTSVWDKEYIQQNRRLLAQALHIAEGALYFPYQVHKTRIVRITPDTSQTELAETDALITNERNICIAVMSADCVPILLYDSRNNAVAAVHSGWRGTVARILEKTLMEMQSAFGTRGEDVIAGIGPSVSQESYQVGQEVADSVMEAFGKESGLLILQPGNKANLDLWKANKIQLLEFGVRESNIEISNLCTVKNNHSFFSARKGDAGRFAAGIMLM